MFNTYLFRYIILLILLTIYGCSQSEERNSSELRSDQIIANYHVEFFFDWENPVQLAALNATFSHIEKGEKTIEYFPILRRTSKPDENYTVIITGNDHLFSSNGTSETDMWRDSAFGFLFHYSSNNYTSQYEIEPHVENSFSITLDRPDINETLFSHIIIPAAPDLLSPLVDQSFDAYLDDIYINWSTDINFEHRIDIEGSCLKPYSVTVPRGEDYFIVTAGSLDYRENAFVPSGQCNAKVFVRRIGTISGTVDAGLSGSSRFTANHPAAVVSIMMTDVP